MYEQVAFCKDNILRLTGFERTALPIELLQKDYAEQTGKKSDFFLLKYLSSSVIIEKDTTLSNIILSLEPWEDLLSEYLDIDLHAYIQEFKKYKQEKPHSDEWIGIGKNIRFSIDFKRGKRKVIETDNGRMLSNGENEGDIKDFSVYDEFYASHYKKGVEDHYSLCDIKISKDIPVYIEKRVKLVQFVSEDQTDEMYLFNENAHSIKNIENMIYIETKSDYLESLNFADFLKSLFRFGFSSYSPQAIEYERMEIEKSIKEMEAGKAKLYTAEEVMELFDKEDEKYEKMTEAERLKSIKEKRKNKSPEEKNWYDYESERVEAIRNRLGHRDTRLVKIEDLKQETIPENRLFNKILKDKE